MSMPPPQPPGWYHAQGDPPGTHRWWDGAQWVGGPVPAGPPPTPYGAQTPPPSYGAPAYAGHGYGSPPLAGFWRRVGGWVLDALILGVPGGIIRAAVAASVPKHTVACTDFRGRAALCEQPTAGGFAVLLLVSLVIFVAGVWYYVYFTGTRGATLGKQACGIRVVDQNTLQPIGTGRAIGRYFAQILSWLPCGLGFFWCIWDDKKQTFHDKLVSSVVVRQQT